jgi:hypothetical protein
MTRDEWYDAAVEAWITEQLRGLGMAGCRPLF